MLHVLFETAYSEEEAVLISNRVMIENTKSEFLTRSRYHDLNTDPFFIKCCAEIDKCDIPMPNVLRDVLTGNTHSFDKISGGVMSLWLMFHYSDKYLFPSCYFGENCYQLLFDICKEKDIYIYENSQMMCRPEIRECIGTFTDSKTGKIVQCKGYNAFLFVSEMGY